MKIVPISGKAQHGKDTFASILGEELKDAGRRVLIIRYADYLKFICATYYGWNGEKDEAGRTLLQQVGTEKVRHVDFDWWVDTVIRFVKMFGVECGDFDYVLIPDTRFPNEIVRLEEAFGKDNVKPIKVERLNFENSLTPEQRLHTSETALDDYKFWGTVFNREDMGGGMTGLDVMRVCARGYVERDFETPHIY